MSAKTAAWYDSMYNNRALVPDHAEHFALWAESSAQARASHKCQLNIAYGTGPNESLDIFPASRPNAPVLVFIHGGYWRSLSKSEHSFVAAPFLAANACVVIPNYPLCPSTTIPAIAQTLTRALQWVHSHISDWGGDPSRITLVGHSAGGHLTAMLARCDWSAVDAKLPKDLVKSALAISGLYDLAPLQQAPILQGDLRLDATQVLRASPVNFAAPKRGDGAPKLHCVVGGDESDEFIRQNQLLQQRWGAKAVPSAISIPGANHFSILDELVKTGSPLNRLALSLI